MSLGFGFGLQYSKLSGGGSGFEGFLNQFPGASLGLSLRLLDINYTGSAIKVRRSSNNDELDIGFVNNELDTASLLDFVGSGNGFVSIWYDQSGQNLDVSQNLASAQPQIVNSGSLILEDNKPSISFNGTSQFLSTSSSFSATNIYISSVVNAANASQNERIYHVKNSGNNIAMIRAVDYPSQLLLFRNLTNNTEFNGPISFKSLINRLYTSINSDTLFEDSELSNGKDSGITSYNGSNGIFIGCRADEGSFANIKAQEFIFYNFDNSSNRVGIENNVNSRYNLY